MFKQVLGFYIQALQLAVSFNMADSQLAIMKIIQLYQIYLATYNEKWHTFNYLIISKCIKQNSRYLCWLRVLVKRSLQMELITFLSKSYTSSHGLLANSQLHYILFHYQLELPRNIVGLARYSRKKPYLEDVATFLKNSLEFLARFFKKAPPLETPLHQILLHPSELAQKF